MTVKLTSNQKATRFIRDASGFSGPSDFACNANFAKNVYFNSNGDTLQPEDVVQTSRTAAVAYTSLDTDWSNILEVPASKLRRGYLRDYDTFGVISNGQTSDYINNRLGNAAYLSLKGPSDIYALYSYKGKATVSGSECTILAGDGSYQNPMIFKYLNKELPTITRSEGAEEVWCGLVIQAEIPLIPYFVQYPTPPMESLSLNTQQLTGRRGTVIFRYVEPKRSYGVRPNQAIMQIFHNATNTFDVVYRADTKEMRIRFFKNGVEATSQTILGNVDITKPITVGVSWKDGLMVAACNGVSKTFVGMSMDTTQGADLVSFTPSKVTLFQANGWVNVYNQAAILNTIAYKRELTAEELAKATNF